VVPALSGLAPAAVVALNPAADAFVGSAVPAGNFGGAGALAIAAPGLPRGEFQSVLRFNTASAVTSFNTTYGVGNWTIQSVSLQLTAAAPSASIFNPQAAGQFAAGWMQNSSWVEGTGGPAAPSATGLNFNTLPSFLSAADEALGTFNFGGASSGASIYPLALTGGLTTGLAAGGNVSLRLSAVGTTIAYVSNSRNFGTVANRPVLTITAIPAPAAALPLAFSALVAIPRRRR